MKTHKKLLFFVFCSLAFSSQPAIQASQGENSDLTKVVEFVKKLVDNLKKTMQTRTFKVSLGDIVDGIPGSGALIPKDLEKFLDGIVFQTPKLEIDGDTYRINWSEALVFGVGTKISARLYVGPGKDGSKSGFSFSIGLPGKWTLNTLLPSIKKELMNIEEALLPPKVREQLKKLNLSVEDAAKVVDWFEFGNIALVLGTQFIDPLWGQLYLGINVQTMLGLAGPLKQITDFLGTDLTKVKFRGVLTPLLSGSEIRTIYPGKINLMPVVDFGLGKFHIRTSDNQIRVGLSAQRFPTVKFIGAGLEVLLPGQTKYIPLKGFIDIVLAAEPIIEVGAQMDGTIKNMFGIPGFDMGRFGLSASLSPAPTWLRGLAVRGYERFGPLLEREAIVSLDTGKKQLVIYSKIGTLTKVELIDMLLHFMDAGVKAGIVKADINQLRTIFNNAVPEFNLGNLEFYLAPMGGEVFDQRFAFGGSLKGDINLFGLGGGFEAAIGYTKLKSTVYLNKILIPNAPGVAPWITISGAGPDLKRGTADDGPIGDFELGLSRQIFALDGLVEIPSLGIKSDTKIRLSLLKGLEFDIHHKIAGLFDTKLKIEGNPTKLESFLIDGHFEQQGINNLSNLLTTEMNKFANKAQADFNKAKVAVTLWERKAQIDIDNWIKHKVAQTQWHIDRLSRWIPDAKRKCKAGNIGVCISNIVNIPAWELERLGHIVHKEVTMKAVVKEAAKFGVKFASDASKLGLNTAKVSVAVAQGLSKFATDIAKGGLNITEIRFGGTLEQLVKKGKMPKVFVKGVILGRQFEQMYQLNFTRPDLFAGELINGLLQVFGPKGAKIVY